MEHFLSILKTFYSNEMCTSIYQRRIGPHLSINLPKLQGTDSTEVKRLDRLSDPDQEPDTEPEWLFWILHDPIWLLLPILSGSWRDVQLTIISYMTTPTPHQSTARP